MEKPNKYLFLENIDRISKKFYYLEKLISKYIFNDIEYFSFIEKDKIEELFDKTLKIKDRFEVRKINDYFYVPIEKSSNKKIHSIYNPQKESIVLDKTNKQNFCYEVYGIGFLYSLYNVRTINIEDNTSNLSSKNTSLDNHLILNKKLCFIDNYLSNPLFDKAQPFFILIDDNLDLFMLSLCYLKIYKIFEDNNIFFYLKGINKDNILKSLVFNSMFNIFNPFFLDKIYIKENLNCFVNSNFNDLKKEWEDFRKELIFNFKTFSINFKNELENIFYNLFKIINSKDLIKRIELNANYKDKLLNNKDHAILIGASPSLDKEEIRKEIMKEIKGKNCLITVVDNGINFALNNKLKPDILFLLDSRNIINLMFSRITQEYKDLLAILPLSSPRKIINKFNNILLFNLVYFNDIYYLLYYILKLFMNNNKSKEIENKYLNKLNLIKNLLSRIPNIEIPVKNVGAFSFLYLKNLGFFNTKTYGIDFSFFQNKYYYKDSYFFNFWNSKQFYFNTTQSVNVKSVLKKGEKYLFEKYNLEWNNIKEKNLNFSYTIFSSNYSCPDIFNRYITFLTTYYYLKCNNKDLSIKYAYSFLQKYFILLFS